MKKKTKKAKSGRTAAQLEVENARLRAKLEKLEVGDTLRFEGEEWFEAVEYFDPETISRIPAMAGIDRVYMMGYVEDVWIIEVPKETPPAQIQDLNEQLRAMGVTAPFLTITDDMKFLKLSRVDEEIGAELDRAELKSSTEAMSDRAALVRAATERAEADAQAQEAAPRTFPGHCPDCGEPGFGEHGCVYCGHGRRRKEEAEVREGAVPDLSPTEGGAEDPEVSEVPEHEGDETDTA